MIPLNRRGVWSQMAFEDMSGRRADISIAPEASSSSRLICTNLPQEANEQTISALFSQ